MNVGVTSAILASIVSLTVAVAILLRRPRRRLYNRFATFTLSLCAYHAGSLISRFGDGAMSQVQSIAAGFAGPFALLFFSTLVRDHSTPVRRYLRLGFGLGAAIAVLGISPIGAHRFFHLLVGSYALFTGMVVLGVLYRHTRHTASNRDRVRLRYLLYGGGIALFLSAGEALETLTGTAVPAALGHVAVTFYVYFLYQSILSRRLINLVELLGKAAVLGVLTLVLATIYSLLVLWVGSAQQGLWLFNTLVASFVILILYDQIRPWVETTTTKLFFRRHYEFRLVAFNLVRSLRTIISIERMGDRLLSAFTGSNTVVSIYLRREGKVTYSLLAHSGEAPPDALTLSHHPTLLQQVRREQRPVILEELINRAGESPALLTTEDTTAQRELERVQESISAMKELNASVLIPMLSEDRVVGLLAVGQEQSSEEPVAEYSADDIVSLMSVAEACAVIVENSQEYEKQRERDRLVEIGEMATGMAHEIRNPLGALKGAAQCLDVTQLKPEQHEFIDVILEEVDRLNGVVVQFLDYARPYRGDPVPTDVNHIIDTTLRLIEHDQIPENIEISKNLGHQLPQVSIDPEQLKQVLLNLFNNAFHAMPDGGTLTLTSFESHKTETPGPEPQNSIKNAKVLIQVTDTGVGIPPNLLHRIFVPFFTTKSRGTGLGLAICQRIIQNSGGKIKVHSRVAQETTFTIHLPALTGPLPPDSP